jgi:hypothetical protein
MAPLLNAGGSAFVSRVVDDADDAAVPVRVGTVDEADAEDEEEMDWNPSTMLSISGVTGLFRAALLYVNIMATLRGGFSV